MNDATLGRCIGLIGGLGVGASVYYYQELAKAHAARGRVLNLAMVHRHVDRVLGAVQAGDKDGLASYLAALIARLASAGAEFAVLPAVAPHIAIAELIKLSPLPLVNLIEELKRDIEVVTPHPDEVDYIHATYLQLVSAGAGLATQRDGLSRLAHTLIERDRVQAVILAGTELALVFDESNTDFPHVNGARLHLNAIATRAMS